MWRTHMNENERQTASRNICYNTAFNLSNSESEVTFAGSIMKIWARFPMPHGSEKKSFAVGIQVVAGTKLTIQTAVVGN